ncbi:hypothetical protein AW736_05980 [Termitidicoccus mucosus]|uniref:Transposase n=2 Tax=Termitidicoccus mucosus TaxID=1184151 RepID=A0A178IMD9_9BACT|nr:hypothetical protein AW736_05980 [Opitutaceae bacterium TSB47]
MLRCEYAPRPARRVRSSLLDAFKDYLCERWLQHGLSAVRLHAEIVAQGYRGAARTVRQFIQSIKSEVFYRPRIRLSTIVAPKPCNEYIVVRWLSLRIGSLANR